MFFWGGGKSQPLFLGGVTCFFDFGGNESYCIPLYCKKYDCFPPLRIPMHFKEYIGVGFPCVSLGSSVVRS